MDENKYIVPDGMLKAVDDALKQIAREAAIRWQNEAVHLGLEWADGVKNPISTLPEPEVPEEIKDLWQSSPTPDTKRRTLEAYHRGQKSAGHRSSQDSAYRRVTQAMGAVTLTREEGDRIIEYIRGAIHG